MAKAATKSKTKMAKAKEPDNSVTCAVLSYFVIGIVWYLVDDDLKKSALAKFHARQALGLLLISIVLSVAVQLIWFILVWIPVLGWAVAGIVTAAVGIGVIVLWIMGIVNAATGKMNLLPFIGEFGAKIAI